MPDVKVGMRSAALPWNLLSDWGTYTPVLTCATTNPNLGSTGEAEGTWYRYGSRIRGFARFKFNGTGISGGTGAFRISLPYAADTSRNIENSGAGGRGTTFGTGMVRKPSGTVARKVVAQPNTSTTVQLYRSGSTTPVDSSTPFAGVDADYRLNINFDYFASEASLPSTPVNRRTWKDGLVLPAGASRNLYSVFPYTPILYSAGTFPNLGDEGTITGWFRLNGFWVIGGIVLRFEGTGLSGGSGTWRLTVPFRAESTLVQLTGGAGVENVVGEAFLRNQDVTSNSFVMTTNIFTDTTIGETALYFKKEDTDTDLSNSVFPGDTGIESQDSLSVRFSYPADPDRVLQYLAG